MKIKNWINFLISILIGIIIWFIPVPLGIKPQAWHLLAIFIATIIDFILPSFSMGVITFIALTTAAVTKTLTIAQALSGFSQSIVWLIVIAFLFCASLQKTGLGKRLAYFLLWKFGDSSLKLGYSIIFSDLILSPVIPSNTARSGGIMYPIVRSLASACGSEPDSSPRKIGAYLIQTVYHGDNVVSSMFLTAMAGNPLIVSFVSQITGVEISWGMWALACVPPAFIVLILLPLFIYKINPPEMKKTPDAKKAAYEELQKMGPMAVKEKILVWTFVLTILGWATTSITKIDSTAIAMASVCIMLLTDVLSWQDVLKETKAWNAMIWMGGIFGMATCLSNFGFFKTLSKAVGPIVSHYSWESAFIILLLVYILTTYGFASGIAHITVMYPVFLTLVCSAGAPVYLAIFVFGFTSAVYQGMTQYSSGSSPIFFGGGYIKQQTWWKYGLMVLFFDLLIFIPLGSLWWKMLGLL